MSKESQALLNEFNSVIKQIVNEYVDSLFVKRKTVQPLLQLTNDEIKVLETISLTPHQVNILRKGMLAMGQGIVFSLLCIIDGVTDVVNVIPDLAIIDRNTKQDIADQFLHDEFIGLLKE
jgi:hypothetical protein